MELNFFTDNDRKIIDILKKAAERMDKRPVVRLAGGWVRDHLIGKENDDFDVCVHGVTADDFAASICEIFENSGVAKLEGHPTDTTTVSISRVNMSNGLWIDITSIDDLFIDAKNRDFTLNAIYYNIIDQIIEDPTDGCSSLKDHEIQISVDPVIAFNDEPRRILRMLRFISILGFTISQNILDAFVNNLDEKNFRSKVSSARIGIEISKMLKGQYFTQAFALILKPKAKLFSLIFDVDGIYKLNPLDAFHRIMNITTPNDSLYFAAIYFPLIETRNQFSGVCRKYQMSMNIANRAKKLTRAHYIFDKQEIPDSYDRYSAAKILMELGEDWKLSSQLLQTEKGKQLFSEFSKFVEREHMENSWDIKPMFNQKELSTILSVPLSKEISKHMENLIRWQIENPLKSKDDFISEHQNK